MADASNNTDVATAPAASSPAVKKSKSAAVAKKPRVKPTHPPTAEMVNNAIKNLKERGGSSLQAIKKYLKGAVANGQLIQTKGKGASGSFKIAATVKSKSTSSRAPKSTAKKPIGEKKAKKENKVSSASAGGTSATKKKATKKSSTAVVKKITNSGEKKKAASATAKAAKKSGNVKTSSPKQKPTKGTKSPIKKPKTPKPKKAAPAKKAAAVPKKK